MQQSIQEEQVFTYEDFDQITTRISEATPKVAKIVQKIKKMTVMIGSTGSGKSSLINYLLKKKVKFQKKGGGKYFITDGQENLYPDLEEKYPNIGNQKQSCTILPNIYGDQYVDLPGWFDTRSSKQEVINGFTNSTMFAPGKQIKIVVIIEANQLQVQRGSILVQIVLRLMQLFELDFAKAINSILLVVSKVRLSEWTIQNIQQELYQISNLNKNLNQTTQFLLKTLIQKKRIAFFPNPDEIQDHIQIIQSKISQLRPTILSHNGCVTLSHKALKVINQSLNILNQNLYNFGKQFCEQLNKFSLQQTPGESKANGDSLNITIQRLKLSEYILKQEIKICLTFERYVELLEELSRKLDIAILIVQKMRKNFTMINFYLSINTKAKIDSKFMEIIISKIIQMILALELERDKLITQEDKIKMQRKFEAEVKQREAKLQKERKQAQEDIKLYQKQLQQQLDKQNKIYKEEMLDLEQERFRIQRQLEQIKKKSQQQNNQVVSFFQGIVQTVLPLVMPKWFGFLNLFRQQERQGQR